MAFIDLPPDIGGFTARRADGRIGRFEFRVFAGEVISAQTGAPRDRKSKGGAPQKLLLRSRTAERRFTFRGLPQMFERSDVAAVIAVFSTADKNGPIIGLGNLDAGERVDFRWRESEILRLLSGEAGDYRKPAARRRAFLLAALKGIGFGLAALLALRLMAGGYGLDPSFTPEAFAPGAVAASLRHSLLAAAAIAVLGALYCGVGAARRVARKAAGQDRALRLFWERVGDALAYVADHRDRYRATAEEDEEETPLTAPSRLLPPPLERENARRAAFEPGLAARRSAAAAAKAATIGDAVRALESAARRRRGEDEFDPFFASQERRRERIRRRAEEKLQESRERRLAQERRARERYAPERLRREDPPGKDLRGEGPRDGPPTAPRREPDLPEEDPSRRRPRRDGGEDVPSFFEPGFSSDRGRLPGRSGRRFN